LLKILNVNYEGELRRYYGFEENETIDLPSIALKRKWILKGFEPDIIRTSQIVLSCFREGKIGKFTLDRIEEYNAI
jgi:ribosome biogenesis GTPase A